MVARVERADADAQLVAGREAPAVARAHVARGRATARGRRRSPDGWTSSPRDSRASGGWIAGSARDSTRRQPSASTTAAREVAAVGVDGAIPVRPSTFAVSNSRVALGARAARTARGSRTSRTCTAARQRKSRRGRVDRASVAERLADRRRRARGSRATPSARRTRTSGARRSRSGRATSTRAPLPRSSRATASPAKLTRRRSGRRRRRTSGVRSAPRFVARTGMSRRHSRPGDCATLRRYMTQTTIPTSDAKVVEGSDGLLLEIDGQIVPNYDATFAPFEEGDVVTGRVVRIDNDEVLVDIGYKSEGVIPSNELSIRKNVDPHDEVELGEEVDALVLTKEDQDGRLIMSKKRARFEKAWRRIEAAAESRRARRGHRHRGRQGRPDHRPRRARLPARLAGRHPPRARTSTSTWARRSSARSSSSTARATTSSCRAARCSRRSARSSARRSSTACSPGLIVEGQISNIVDFGAFVDLNGIDGLIHISELSWSHVNHPTRDPDDRRHRPGQGARHRPRPPAHLPGPQADPGGPVAARRRHLQRRRRARGHGHEGRHVRRVRRDPRRRRGPRAHLRAGPPPRREPARDRRSRATTCA